MRKLFYLISLLAITLCSNATELISEGGYIGWSMGGVSPLYEENENGIIDLVRDESGQPVTSSPEFHKEFRGQEQFIFPESKIYLRPMPDENHVFTYWLIDGVIVLEEIVGEMDNSTGMIMGGFNSFTIEEGDPAPQSIQAVFSPKDNGTTDIDLSPIGNPTIDLSLNPNLHQTTIVSEGGYIGWSMGGVSPLFENEDGSINMVLDETGQPATSAPEFFKEFRVQEQFIFPESKISLRPMPDENHVFTYWLIDGVIVMGEIGSESDPITSSLMGGFNSFTIEEGDPAPQSIQAVFSPKDNGTTDLDLSPVGNPTMDLSLNPNLHQTTITSEGGYIGWSMGGVTHFFGINKNGVFGQLLDESGKPFTSAPEFFKEFRGQEQFIFPESKIYLRPMPDENHVFTYWLIDGLVVMGELDGEEDPYNGMLMGGFNSFNIEEGDPAPQSIQAVFSPKDNGTTDLDLSPIGNPTIDLSLNLNLHQTTITSEGGYIGWSMGGISPLYETNEDGIIRMVLDETGQPVTSAPEFYKDFRGQEQFVFPESKISLRPMPNENHVFTYWLIDGVVVHGEIDVQVDPITQSIIGGFNSFTIEEGDPVPQSIQAVFSNEENSTHNGWNEDVSFETILENANLGSAYYEGLASIFIRTGESDQKIDLNSSFAWSQKASNQNHPFGIYNLAKLAFIEGNLSKATYYYEEAKPLLMDMASGDPIALYCLGEISFQLIPTNISQALDYFHKSAELGFPLAKATLGALYLKGLDDFLEANTTRGIQLLTDAANNGSLTANFNMGMAYYNGDGVQKDNFKAIEFLEIAAGQNFADAQYFLGKILLEENETKNISRGLVFLQKASNQDHVPAIELLKELDLSFDLGWTWNMGPWSYSHNDGGWLYYKMVNGQRMVWRQQNKSWYAWDDELLFWRLK